MPRVSPSGKARLQVVLQTTFRGREDRWLCMYGHAMTPMPVPAAKEAVPPSAIDLSCHLLIGYSLVLMAFNLARSQAVRWRRLRSSFSVLLSIHKTIGVFVFAWIFFAESTSCLYLLPFHLGS
jgi:hypothetical protein